MASDRVTNISGYQILEEIYAGTRTLVYRGTREADKLPVIIKLMRKAYPTWSEIIQFCNQYSICQNLHLDGVIKPLSLENYQNGYVFVMEDFGGISLKAYAAKYPRSILPLNEFLAIAIQIASILESVHRARVIHKDIKPANIVINPETKQIKLIDFSIASLLPKETQTLKSPHVLEGTLAYFSPEQTGRMNRGIDYRSDFYSLGITFYELLTGQLPFISNDAMELVYCHIAKQLTPVDQINPEIPAALAEIVSKLMAKNAEDRYKTLLGLKYDLEVCLAKLQNFSKIDSFQLFTRDISDRFIIPEKLYGRASEVEKILEAFERVAGVASDKIENRKSKIEMLLIAGFSGIGKTAIVNEVHKPIVERMGYFIKGKYDQFQRDIPFSAIVQALRDLIQQLLSESNTSLQKWKSKILQALGENAQVIIDVIPELECIIGKQPPVTQLLGTAAQNRFNLLFQKLIEVFANKEHLLVIFLDDLQWADFASLKLIQLLMTASETGNLLIVGAYRDNEVSPAHPLMLTLDEISKTVANINTIALAPLTECELNHLVADTLNCNRQIAKPLTEFIYQKTKGNPFFSRQFLKFLHEEGLISFNLDSECGYWECDLAKVKEIAVSNDVVEFMALELQKLPRSTQDVLKLAACIGNEFDLATLSIVCEKPQAETAAILWKALQSGLVIPINDVYKFYQSESSKSQTKSTVNNDQLVINYKFSHDRVQQAAYFLIPEDQKQTIHLNIGNLFLKNTTESERLENVFDIVNHLNLGAELITHSEKRYELAHLNLVAGKKAKVSTAYDAAIKYLTTGIDLLPTDCWQSEYEITLAFYIEMVEAEYLNTNFGQSEKLGEIIMQQANNLLDRIKAYELKIQSYLAQNLLVEAINVAIPVLEILGISLSESSDNNLQVLKLPDFADLEKIPEMTDVYKMAALRILNSIGAAIVNGKPSLFPSFAVTMVNLCIQHGHSPLAAQAYIWYALFLCIIGDIDTGYHSAQLALYLLENYNAKELKSILYTLHNFFVRHRKEHAKETLASFLSGMQNGIETGDLVYASFCSVNFCLHLFFVGAPLENVNKKQEQHHDIILKTKQEYPILSLNIFRQLTLFLQSPVALQSCLLDEKFNEAIMLPQLKSINIPSLLFTAYSAKLILFYLLEEPNMAIANAKLAEEHTASVSSWMIEIEYNFYYSLALLANYHTCDEQTQKEYLDRVVSNQKTMRFWADHAPMNYQHKYDLVSAEKARVLLINWEAADLYDRAIAGAKEQNYIQEEALANELAALLYLEWNKEKIAQTYMIEAYYCYSRWGAVAKVQDLEKRYSQLLAPILQQQKTYLNPTETISNFVLTNQTATSTSTISDALDFASAIKASQALSCEIEFEQLLAKLMQVLMLTAGAKKVALILPKDDTLVIEAYATLDNEIKIIQSIPLDSFQEISKLPINYVNNTLETLLIDNATTLTKFASDDYILQVKPKSLLVTPIFNQGKLIGIIYLENNSTAGVFTSERLEVIKLLCSQAAISLENARLYQKVQEYAHQLEKSLEELKQAQLQLVQSEKMSALGNLVAGVAHEINNPVGFIVGNIQPALDGVQDLFNLINLYQAKLQNSDLEIQKMIKKIDLEYLREDLPKIINSMKVGVERIENISNSLRTFSRADTNNKVLFNIHNGLDSTILILKHRLKASDARPAIEVVKDYAILPEILCYPGQLNQVFMNLLANAIDALEESNVVRTFEDIQAHPNRIAIATKLSEDRKQVIISFKDNGLGISSEVKEKIFDYLYTTKPVGKGTGLGLAIARQIVVEKHGGYIEVNSVPGQGAEFVISIPA